MFIYRRGGKENELCYSVRGRSSLSWEEILNLKSKGKGIQGMVFK